MWHERCTHCGRRHLFGIRRVVSLEVLTKGLMKVTWRCPHCEQDNELLTGSAVPSPLPVAV